MLRILIMEVYVRKALTTAALALGALGVTAGAASADPVINDNEHPQFVHGGLVNVALQDVLTNAEILDDVNVLNDGVHVLDDGVHVDADADTDND